MVFFCLIALGTSVDNFLYIVKKAALLVSRRTDTGEVSIQIFSTSQLDVTDKS